MRLFYFLSVGLFLFGCGDDCPELVPEVIEQVTEVTVVELNCCEVCVIEYYGDSRDNSCFDKVDWEYECSGNLNRCWVQVLLPDDKYYLSDGKMSFTDLADGDIGSRFEFQSGRKMWLELNDLDLIDDVRQGFRLTLTLCDGL